MSYTENEAEMKSCARDLSRMCVTSQCMAWRWVPLKADDAFAEAVKKAAEDIGDKSPSRHRSAKHVARNRAKYGLPDKPFLGYCGLGGKPHDYPIDGRSQE